MVGGSCSGAVGLTGSSRSVSPHRQRATVFAPPSSERSQDWAYGISKVHATRHSGPHTDPTR